MPRRLLKLLWKNLGTLLLAFALAFAVWISAVVAADPNEERSYPRAIELEIRNLESELILVGNLPKAVNVTISAPTSLWDQLISDVTVLEAFINLVDYSDGEHTISVNVESSLHPVRIVSVDPEEVSLLLEPRLVRELPVMLNVEGQVALGFQIENISFSPLNIMVSGPEGLMGQIDAVVATVEVNEARESKANEVELVARDDEGNILSGLSLTPSVINAQVEISRAGGYREVAVAVETMGLPAQGFRVIDISVNPPILTLFSDDIQLIESLPGFVSTLPLDLSDAVEDVESRLALNLPDNVSVEGDQQSVEVVIGIAPIESSKPITVPVEIIGLAAGASVEKSPESASLILSGPLTVLEALEPGDVRLIVDVSDLDVGTHLLGPKAEILPEDVIVLSITPSSVEVVITVNGSSE